VKGPRVKVDANLGEIRGDAKEVAGVITRNKLLYGYKRDANLPLSGLEYSSESQRAKGWYKFATWRENFPQAAPKPVYFAATGELANGSYGHVRTMSALEYWVNWLPLEVVEDQFISVPPIARDSTRIASKVTQIVSIEKQVRDAATYVIEGGNIDAAFPQNEHSCTYPGRCAMYDACWTANVGDDMAGSGLYVPRKDHHAIEGE
jgi:hypothetical protein